MNQQEELQQRLEAIRFGLFRMGKNRKRAMSTHETEDLIEVLEAEVARVIELTKQQD